MKQIAVGSTSELKIRAVQRAAKKLELEAEVRGYDIPSGVSEQPTGFPETMQGARNRAHEALKTSQADVGVGIEGGIVYFDEVKSWFDMACVVLAHRGGGETVGFSASQMIPDWLVEEARHTRTDIGVVLQRVVGGGEKDTFHYFSQGMLTREGVLTEALTFAFTRLLHPERYKNPGI